MRTTTTTGSAAPATPAPRETQTQLSLYWVRNGEVLATSHRWVTRTARIGAVAIEALLGGPNELERGAGLTSSIPDGSKLLGLSISGGTASIDFNATYASGGGAFSTQARLAQVVFTLTQFDTVQRVRFEINGVPVNVFGSEGLILDHPLSRSDEYSLLPSIFLETPAVGDTISSPLRISGISNTYEATFEVQLVDPAGKVIVDQPVTASAGTGIWGTFSGSYPFSSSTPGTGRIVVFEISPKDGTRMHEADIPVRLR